MPQKRDCCLLWRPSGCSGCARGARCLCGVCWPRKSSCLQKKEKSACPKTPTNAGWKSAARYEQQQATNKQQATKTNNNQNEEQATNKHATNKRHPDIEHNHKGSNLDELDAPNAATNSSKPLTTNKPTTNHSGNNYTANGLQPIGSKE